MTRTQELSLLCRHGHTDMNTDTDRQRHTHLAGEAQHELGIDPGPRSQQRHCSGDDQRHLPASREGNRICPNDGHQVLDDHPQLIPHGPPDAEGVGGQPPCYCPT